MKKITITLLLVIAVLMSNAQQLKYESVVRKENIPKRELGLRCASFTRFMQSTFRTNVVSDTLNGAFTYQYSFPYTTDLFGASYINGSIRTMLEVYVKDGRYKIVFLQFEHIGNKKSYGLITVDEQCPQDRREPLVSEKYSTKRWDDIKKVINSHVDFVSVKLSELLDKPSEQSNDW